MDKCLLPFGQIWIGMAAQTGLTILGLNCKLQKNTMALFHTVQNLFLPLASLAYMYIPQANNNSSDLRNNHFPC